MKKVDREMQKRCNASHKLVNQVRDGFSRTEAQYLIFCVKEEDVDWQILETCEYPMHRVSPKDAEVPSIAFKRKAALPDYVWNQETSQKDVWRP